MSDFFSEAQSAEVVNGRLSRDMDPRLRIVMEDFITHLHGFIKDVESSTQDWEAAIDFLTRTEQTCSGTR